MNKFRRLVAFAWTHRCRLVSAVLLGTAFLSFLFVVEGLHGAEAISHKQYLSILWIYRDLLLPGDVLAGPFLSASDLSAVHLMRGAYARTLSLLTVLNVIGWWLVLEGTYFSVARLISKLSRAPLAPPRKPEE